MLLKRLIAELTVLGFTKYLREFYQLLRGLYDNFLFLFGLRWLLEFYVLLLRFFQILILLIYLVERRLFFGRIQRLIRIFLNAYETIWEAIRIDHISILLENWLLVYRSITHELWRSRITNISFVKNLDRASAALIIRKSNHPIILLVLDRKFNFIAYRVMAGVEVS